MYTLKGKLTPDQHKQLGTPEAKFDTTDIPLIVKNAFKQKEILIRDCFLGLQYRAGGLKIGVLEVLNVVNDSVSCWGGDIDIKHLYIDHTLPSFHSPKNHPDVFHIFSMCHRSYKRDIAPVKNVTIEQAYVKVRGNKGHFMGTEICGYENFKLFAKGLDIDSDSPQPALNFINYNGEIGSPSHPIDPKRISNLPIRIKGVKPNSPPSKNIVIHAYKGLKLELDASAKRASTVIYYGRNWTLEQREQYYLSSMLKIA